MAGGRTVILGGGFAGLVAALRLAKGQTNEEVVLVDAGGHHVYTPWLYEVATGFLMEDDKAELKQLRESSQLSLAKVCDMAKRKNLRFRKAEVVGLDVDAKHVLLHGGKTLSYDRVVVALGSQIETFGIKGIEEYAHTLRSVGNANDIRKSLHKIVTGATTASKLQTIIIAGAGATGVETAAELANFLQRCRERSVCPSGAIRLVLLDAAPTILSQFSPRMRNWAQTRLERLGVEIMTDTMVTKVSESSITLKPRQMSDDEMSKSSCPFQEATEVDADLLIWSGGVRPNEVLKNFDLPKDKRGRVKITASMQVEGLKDVFAIGDACALTNPKTGVLVPPAAYTAIQQAKLLAGNLARSAREQSMLNMKFQKVHYWVIPLGGKYALASLGFVAFKGYFAYVLRRLIDLHYFTSILPIRFAFAFWRKSTTIFTNND